MDRSFTFKNFTDLTQYEKTMILEWRNHPSVREVMYSRSEIEIEAHLSFIDRLLGLENEKKYFLVFKDDTPVGVMNVHYECKNKVEFGYYISPKYFGTDLSVVYYYRCLEFIFDSIDVDIVFGYIKKENKKAYLLTKLFGFTRTTTKKEIKGEGVNDYYYVELNKDLWRNSLKQSDKIKNLIGTARKA